jgi:hypothetical protein
VITTDINRAELNGDASATVFIFRSGGTNIPVTDESHIKVYVNGVLKTITTHYTVAIVSKLATVTFTSGNEPGTGTGNVIFLREVPFKQETDLANNSQLEAESLESQLDLIVNQAQQLNDKTSRDIRLSDTLIGTDSTEAQTTLNKTVLERANKSLKFDGSGNIDISTVSIDDASTYATNANQSYLDAVAQVALANTARVAAEAAESGAETVLDTFDDRFLGVKGSDPTVDNDGAALVDGAIYYSSATDAIKVYDSSATPTWRQITTTVANQTNIDALVLGTDGTASPGGTNLNIAQVNTVALKINDVSNYADQYQISAFTENAGAGPLTDGGGNALSDGDMAFDTTLNGLRVWNGTTWSSGVNTTDGVIIKHEYVANGSNTHFVLAHDQGMEIVYLNGVKLKAGDGSTNNDYFSVSGGSSTTYVGDDTAATHIYFHSAPSSTHLVSLHAWGASANTLAVPKAGGTYTGSVSFSAGLTGTLTGTLTGNASTATTAGTVTTAAQPAITSVGTLTGFTSTGIDDNATSNAITIDASERVGIGTTTPCKNAAGADWGGGWGSKGKFHFMGADGSAGSNVSANQSLVLENNTDDGISIITPDDHSCSINFGTNGDDGVENEGIIEWSQTFGLQIKTNHSGADITFRTGSNAERMVIDDSGNIGAPNGTNIYNASDFRLKKDITNLSGSLAKINQMQAVSFKWIDGFCDNEQDKTHYGLVAQDVAAIDTNLVSEFGKPIEAKDAVTDKEGNIIEEAVEASPHVLDIKGQKIETPLRVEEKYIIFMLIEAVKELSGKVAALENA